MQNNIAFLLASAVVVVAAPASAQQGDLQDLSAEDIAVFNEFIINEVYEVETIAEIEAARAKIAAERRVKQCFIDFLPYCALRDDLGQQLAGADDPASLTVTIDRDGRDFASAHAAFSANRPAAGGFLGAGVQWDRDSSSKDRQNQLQAGVLFAVDLQPSAPSARETRRLLAGLKTLQGDAERAAFGDLASGRFWTLRASLSGEIVRTAVYPDAEEPVCAAPAPPIACTTQFRKTFRAVAEAAPFAPQFESIYWSDQFNAKEDWYFVVGPSIKLFYDQTLDRGVQTLAGDPVYGSVLGIVGAFDFKARPSLSGSPWEFGVSANIVHALDRDEFRAADFARTSRLFKAAVTYKLGDDVSALLKAEGSLTPSISLEYTNGADAFAGAQTQDKFVISFGLKY